MERKNETYTGNLTGIIVIYCFFCLVFLLIALLAAAGVRKRDGLGISGAGRKYRTELTSPVFLTDLQDDRVEAFGNEQKYIAIHFLGVPADGHSISRDGVGAHFYIYSDGTIYQSASLDAVPWQVGTAGCYEQLHEEACNYNTIGIELCPLCDGDADDDYDPTWYFTTETQEACVLLVRSLMKELRIPADHVLRHGDIVSKYCPAPYFNNNNYRTSWTWDEFCANVRGLDGKLVPDLPFC